MKHLYNFSTMLVQHRRRWAGAVQIIVLCLLGRQGYTIAQHLFDRGPAGGTTTQL